MGLIEDIQNHTSQLNQAAGFSDAVDINQLSVINEAQNPSSALWASTNKKVFWISLICLGLFLLSRMTKYPRIEVARNAYGENATHVDDAKLDMSKIPTEKLKGVLSFFKETIETSNPSKRDHDASVYSFGLICEKIKDELKKRKSI